MAKKKIYAVRKGHKTGLFYTWDECKKAVYGYSGAEYKGFLTKEEAEAFLNIGAAKTTTNKNSSTTTSVDSTALTTSTSDRLVVYVDGSFDVSIQKYSFGCVILLEDGRIIERSGNGEEPELLAIRNVAGEMHGAMYAVQWAFENGYSSVVIHYDYEGIETKLRTLDVAAYAAEYERIRGMTDFPVNFGIEIGLRPECAERTKQMAESYPFDFIIGSSHITAGKDMAYDSSFFRGRTRKEAYMVYFNEVLENIKTYDIFDVYGHLDYVVRYGGYPQKKLDYAEFSDILDEIFRALIRRDKGIEINTSGIRYGLGTFCPNRELLKRYLELGGKIITLGSDAHRADDLAADFGDAVELLKGLGVKELAVFRKRQPEWISLREF